MAYNVNHEEELGKVTLAIKLAEMTVEQLKCKKIEEMTKVEMCYDRRIEGVEQDKEDMIARQDRFAKLMSLNVAAGKKVYYSPEKLPVENVNAALKVEPAACVQGGLKDLSGSGTSSGSGVKIVPSLRKPKQQRRTADTVARFLFGDADARINVDRGVVRVCDKSRDAASKQGFQGNEYLKSNCGVVGRQGGGQMGINASASGVGIGVSNVDGYQNTAGNDGAACMESQRNQTTAVKSLMREAGDRRVSNMSSVHRPVNVVGCEFSGNMTVPDQMRSVGGKFGGVEKVVKSVGNGLPHIHDVQKGVGCVVRDNVNRNQEVIGVAVQQCTGQPDASKSQRGRAIEGKVQGDGDDQCSFEELSRDLDLEDEVVAETRAHEQEIANAAKLQESVPQCVVQVNVDLNEQEPMLAVSGMGRERDKECVVELGNIVESRKAVSHTATGGHVGSVQGKKNDVELGPVPDISVGQSLQMGDGSVMRAVGSDGVRNIQNREIMKNKAGGRGGYAKNGKSQVAKSHDIDEYDEDDAALLHAAATLESDDGDMLSAKRKGVVDEMDSKRPKRCAVVLEGGSNVRAADEVSFQFAEGAGHSGKGKVGRGCKAVKKMKSQKGGCELKFVSSPVPGRTLRKQNRAQMTQVRGKGKGRGRGRREEVTGVGGTTRSGNRFHEIEERAENLTDIDDWEMMDEEGLWFPD